LSESIFSYRSLWGRRYQNSSTTEYWGPNDDTQNNGLDIAHHFITMLLGNRLFEAPIPEHSARILDVGTGTGVWAIDVADTYPSAEIFGTDISPIQPSWVPPNCSFHIEDAQLEWTYTPSSFDFVHVRALYGSIKDWPALYREAHLVLKPGGWIENFEFNIRLHSDIPEIRDDPDHIFKRWANVFIEAGERMGRSLRIGMNGLMARYMQDCGFVNIVQKSYQVPVGSWSSDPTYQKIGLYNLAFMDESLEGFALFMLREIMGWEYTRVQVFVAEMRNAIRNAKIRPYYAV
jgi:ubiquinone/menaquinone biosynthesis C-methylase UbiE